MSQISVFCKEIEIARAIQRYLKFVMNIKDIEVTPLMNPYNRNESFKMAMKSDLVLVDAFWSKKPNGFQFAKWMDKLMDKRVLLFFYAGEIDFEEEGPFWLVLPSGLERLRDKVNKLMENPVLNAEEYEKLEERFPELREHKGHHR